MSALFLVVPLALLVSGVAVWAFVWSVKHGQMDDLNTPGMRILQEDSRPEDSSAQAHRAKKNSS